MLIFHSFLYVYQRVWVNFFVPIRCKSLQWVPRWSPGLGRGHRCGLSKSSSPFPKQPRCGGRLSVVDLRGDGVRGSQPSTAQRCIDDSVVILREYHGIIWENIARIKEPNGRFSILSTGGYLLYNLIPSYPPDIGHPQRVPNMSEFLQNHGFCGVFSIGEGIISVAMFGKFLDRGYSGEISPANMGGFTNG